MNAISNISAAPEVRSDVELMALAGGVDEGSDAELIAACERYFDLQRHFETYGDKDIDDDDPALGESSDLVKKIAALPAVTLEGHAARAKVAMNLDPGVFESLNRYESGAILRAMLRDLTAGGAA